MKKLTYEEILSERKTPEDLKKSQRYPINIILDNIRSLYNVGSIFRTCDAAMVNKLILCGLTPHPPRKEIAKTALDAQETVPWQYFENTTDAIQSEKESGSKIIAVELTDQKKIYTDLVKSDFPTTLVLGNELTGISEETLNQCDDAIEIPMYGLKHSLNVSVSAGIVIFEAVNKYRKYYKELS